MIHDNTVINISIPDEERYNTMNNTTNQYHVQFLTTNTSHTFRMNKELHRHQHEHVAVDDRTPQRHGHQRQERQAPTSHPPPIATAPAADPRSMRSRFLPAPSPPASRAAGEPVRVLAN